MSTTPEPVKYEGYRPETERTHYSVPSMWGTRIPMANARLIAAAPDLLEAAESLVGSWQRGEPWGNDIAALRAAIQKAKGEQA